MYTDDFKDKGETLHGRSTPSQKYVLNISVKSLQCMHFQKAAYKCSWDEGRFMKNFR